MRRTMKKLLACFTALALTMSFASVALAASPADENVTAIVNTRTPITDSSFDQYFGGTTAADGVLDLLNKGAVYINGRQVPYLQENGKYSSELYLVNGFTALERLKNEDTGAYYWRWDLHASVRGNTNNDSRTEQEQFDAARLAIIEGASVLLGFTTELVGNPVSKIMFTVKSSAQVTEVSINGDNAVIKGTEHNGSRGYGTDLTADTFPIENVSGDIKAGDLVLFWQDERDGNAGWNIERAIPVSGKLTGDDDYGDKDDLTLDFIINDERIPQAVLRRDGLAIPVRPSQFLEEHLANEKQDYPVLAWTTETGHIIGISYDVADKTALGETIKTAQTALADIVISDDGYDVWTTQKWMKEAVLRVMNMMVSGAVAVYNNEAATQAEVDAAYAQLARVAPAIPYQAAAGYRVPLGEAMQAEIVAKIFEKSNVFESFNADVNGRSVLGGATAGNSITDAVTVQDLIDDFVTSAESVEDLTGLVTVVAENAEGQKAEVSADTALGTGMIVEIQTGGDPMEMVVVIKNDLTGDGITDLSDLQAMAQEMQSPGTLSSEQILAAAIPETNENSVLNMLSVLVNLSQTMMGNT